MVKYGEYQNRKWDVHFYMSEISSQMKTVRQLFNGGISYRIPPFQRQYVWQEEQWTSLWDDFCSVLDRYTVDGKETDPHFIGTIMIQEREDVDGIESYRIIDGQQRLTTLQIMIKAALDIPKVGIGANDWIDNLRVNTERFVTNNVHNRLKIYQTNREDRESFLSVMDINPAENKDAYESLMHQCYYFYLDKINDRIKDTDVSESYRVFKPVIETLLVMNVIETHRSRNAYKDFEALNNRGMDLELDEIVKNMFLWKADVGDNEEEAHKTWGVIFNDPYWREREQRGANRNIKRIETFLSSWIMIQSGHGPGINTNRISSSIDSYLKQYGSRDIMDIAAQCS